MLRKIGCLLLLTSSLRAEEASKIDLVEIFQSSPTIYSILLAFSLFAFTLWLYSLFTVKVSSVMPSQFLNDMRHHLLKKNYDAAAEICQKSAHPCAVILGSGISARKYGHQAIRELMQTEGKRCGVTLWQRISLLNDIAIISPMLGLLGTVMGLFYAFYDVNRSADTLASIFDGLGIAVGTTVAGLIVAILAMIFYATLKFRVIRLLNQLESETLTLGSLIEEL